MMPERQDLDALCHTPPLEILEIIRENVYTAKLQERRDMGWNKVLGEIRNQSNKKIFYERFVKTGLDISNGQIEEFLNWFTNHINDVATDFALGTDRKISVKLVVFTHSLANESNPEHQGQVSVWC